jgi:hypothetical protein
VVVDAWAHACSKVFQRSTVWVLAPLMAASAVLAAPTAAPAAPPAATPIRLPAAANAPNEDAAMKLAAKSGTRVEVMSERTEYEQFFAEPDGRLTYETTVLPQRVKRSGGTWADVKLTLEQFSDGSLRPHASVADVRFSPDGKGPVVTLAHGGRTFTMSLLGGALRAPKLIDSMATYEEVMPGVDLVVRPTELGFSHVLKIKTANAATNPDLRAITFELGGDAKVSRLADGSLQAVAGRTIVATAPAPAMWDSSNTVVAAKNSAGSAAPLEGAASDPSTAAAPGDAALTAPVETELTASGDLVLKPDEAMLAGAATFPVFIDPEWSTGKKRWAYSTNNNTNNSDVSRARVGMDPDGRIYRPYFEFATSAIKNKHVESARVQMELDHSWSCTDTWTNMFSANPIASTPRTKWKSSSPFLRHLSAQESHANEGTGCSDSPQPDMTVNFASSAVTSWLDGVAQKGSATATVAFSAGNETQGYESAKDRWKKFFPNQAKLIADVDAVPGVPTVFYVNGVRCGSSTLGIGTTALKFSATMPDADTSQAIKATWEWQRSVNGAWVGMPAPSPSSTPAKKLATSAAVTGAVDGFTYRFRVMGTDPSPYLQSSSWSTWCNFKIDTADPIVTGAVTVQPTGPGEPGQFTLTSHDADLTKFRYGWNAPVIEAVPSSSTTTGGVTTKTLDLKLSPPKYGFNTLYFQGVDTTGNVGDGSVSFTVDRAAAPVARWGLARYPGVSTADAIADLQPARGGNTPLIPQGVTWMDQGRIVGGTEATFSGAGTLTTAAPVVDTTTNYSVAAWVRLENLNGYQNIVAQDGEHTTNFQLQYRSDDRNADGVADKSFCFTIRGVDVDSTTNAVSACGLNTAVAGRWTHVAGAFDAVERKMRVWVDGVLRQELAAPTAWSAAGSLRVGNRKLSSTQFADDLHGGVADVQVFDRVLVGEDFTGDDTDPGEAVEGERGMLSPIEVARWTFSDATLCYDPRVVQTCEEPDNDTGFGSMLRLAQGVDVLPGASGNYASFDTDQIYPDDPSDPFYGIKTQEFGKSQSNAGSANTPLWQDAKVLNTDQSFTVSTSVQLGSINTHMTALAAKGNKQSAFYLGTRISVVKDVQAQRFEIMVPSLDADVGETYTHVIAPEPLAIDDSGSWHELTAVYDSGPRTMQLYVNGVAKTPPVQVNPWKAGGPLLVGSHWYSSDNAAGRLTDSWFGGIDDIHIYHGAMTDAQVAAHYAATES